MKNNTPNVTSQITRLALIATACCLSACATGSPGVSQYGMGSDRAAIADARNRQDAVISRSELQQNRMQRSDVSEEMDLDAKKRRAGQENAVAPLETFARGSRAVRSILSGW